MLSSKYDEIAFANAMFPIKVYIKSRVPMNYVQLTLTWHEQLEIIRFRKGGAVVQIGNQRYVAGDNDIFIFNPCEPHSLNAYTGFPEFDCIMIDKQIYSSTEKDICEHKYVKPIENHQICFDNHIRNCKELLDLIDRMLYEIANNEFAYELAVKGLTHNMLAYLFRNHANTIKTNTELKKNMLSYERLNPVFQYIETNYADEIKIEHLASLTYLSTSHFSRLFKHVTGKTATHYINEFRISKAEVLLKTTDLSVSEIAERVGFINSSYFAKWLKTLKNTTPTELRKMNGK